MSTAIKRIANIPDREVDAEFENLLKQVPHKEDYDNTVNTVTTIDSIVNGIFWDDIVIDPAVGRLPAANTPAIAAYKGSEVLSFEDNIDNDTTYFDIQLPHNWAEGTIIKPHLHYVIDTDGAGAGAENIKFNLTYSWADIGEVFPAQSTLTNTVDVQDESQDTLRVFSFGNIPASSKKISSVLLCSLSRDIGVANNYGGHVYVLSVDFHIQCNIYGSKELFIKQ